ncbi:hypothetical protein IAT38_000854 [Cryptococcus sp. DSM 104549]
MSSSSSDMAALNKINFTGGLPTSVDLAPSIVFLIIYALSIPIIVWRLVSKQHRTLVLLRPVLFLLCRLGTLGLRAWMAKNSYGEQELIAELVMVSIGNLFLIEPIIACWKLHVESDVSEAERPAWIKRLAMALRFCLIGAIAIAIAGSTTISSALQDSSKLSTVTTLRKVASILALAVIVLAIVATTLTHYHLNLTLRPTLWLYAVEVPMLIVSVYKLAQQVSTSADDAVRSRAAFWVLQMLFELVTYALIIGISIPAWFPGAKKAPEYSSSDVEMGQASQQRLNSYGSERK